VKGLLLALQWAQWVVFVGLAVVTFLLWRRHRSEAAAWAAATFGSLALVVIAAAFYGPDPEPGAIPEWFTKLLVAVIVLFPYFLFRFAATFLAPARSIIRTATVVVGAMLLWTFFLPHFPEQGTPPRGMFLAYLVALIVIWTALSLPVALMLWMRGRRQPTLPRRRMRFLALATFGINLSIVISGSSGGSEADLRRVITQTIGLLSAAAFYLAFAPPGPLRAWWRRTEEASLQRAAVGVSGATTLDDVTEVLLPKVAPLFGGRGAVLIGKTHGVIGAHGIPAFEADLIDADIRAGRGEHGSRDVITLPLRNGWIAVQSSAYTPFFGNEEIDLLRSIGAFIDLAIDRSELFEAERRARAEVERASEELESFLYSVSHDLKSPLVALSGYIGYLLEDYGDRLGGEGREFVERMTANAKYMEDLIQDLLELSRIGRMQTEPSDVDVEALVRDIGREIESLHPGVSVLVSSLPDLWMNPLRARQLFTNLIENAAQHAGRPDVNIHISSITRPDGSAEVSIRDNGQGIPADYRERVFRVFERLEPDDEGGTGIGLSICRKIVDSLEGRIWVEESTEGTDIRIEFGSEVTRPRKAEVRA
jgi:signal transduction histidine kinase